MQDPITSWTKRGVTEVWFYYPNITHYRGNASHTIVNDGDSNGDGSSQYEVWLQPKTVGGHNSRASAGLEVGDVFTMGQRVGVSGFLVTGGDEVVFLDVTAHACVNECFTSAYSTKLSILGGGLVLKPGRFKAGNDGGHNHHSARIGAWVEGGRWEGTGDDICHVSGLVFSAVQQWVDHTNGTDTPMLRLHMLDGEPHAIRSIMVGDVLQFLNRTTGELFSEQRVVSVTIDATYEYDELGANNGAMDENGGKGVVAPTVVSLDGWPGALDLGVIGNNFASATNIYNLNVTASQFVFRANKVASGRRYVRGLFLMYTCTCVNDTPLRMPKCPFLTRFFIFSLRGHASPCILNPMHADVFQFQWRTLIFEGLEYWQRANVW